MKTLRTVRVLYICLTLSLIIIGLAFLDEPMSHTDSLSCEGDWYTLGFILLFVLPTIGMCFLFRVPGRQKWLPWISIVALIWEAPIIRSIPFSPIWDWIGFVLSVAMICLTVACFVRNEINSQKSSAQSTCS